MFTFKYQLNLLWKYFYIFQKCILCTCTIVLIFVWVFLVKDYTITYHGEAVPVPCKTCVWQNICYSISTQGWHSLHANLYKTFTFLSLPFEFQQGVFWLIVWVRRRRTIMSAFFFLSPAMLWFFLLLFLLFNLADWCILLGWFSGNRNVRISFYDKKYINYLNACISIYLSSMLHPIP